jgi:hypothetical protein
MEPAPRWRPRARLRSRRVASSGSSSSSSASGTEEEEEDDELQPQRRRRRRRRASAGHPVQSSARAGDNDDDEDVAFVVPARPPPAPPLRTKAARKPSHVLPPATHVWSARAVPSCASAYWPPFQNGGLSTATLESWVTGFGPVAAPAPPSAPASAPRTVVVSTAAAGPKARRPASAVPTALTPPFRLHSPSPATGPPWSPPTELLNDLYFPTTPVRLSPLQRARGCSQSPTYALTGSAGGACPQVR